MAIGYFFQEYIEIFLSFSIYDSCCTGPDRIRQVGRIVMNCGTLDCIVFEVLSLSALMIFSIDESIFTW